MHALSQLRGTGLGGGNQWKPHRSGAVRRCGEWLWILEPVVNAASDY